MTLNTYTNNSDDYKLNKSLTAVESDISISLKDDTEIINPIVILSRNVNTSFNYCYIPQLHRYYFVRGFTHSQDRIYVNLEVDALMSFKSQINNLTIIADRSSNIYNCYQCDNEIPFENRNIISTQPFSGGFLGQSLILAVNGG